METDRKTQRFARITAMVVGAFFLVSGMWAMLAPRSFFDTVAMFEPYNVHFLHDIGAFQIGLGAVLALAAFTADALFVTLTGVAIASAAHLLSHVVDRDLGGAPATDIPFFAVVTVALIGAAVSRSGAVRQRAG